MGASTDGYGFPSQYMRMMTLLRSSLSGPGASVIQMWVMMPAPLTSIRFTRAPSATLETLSPLPPVRSQLPARRDLMSEPILARFTKSLAGSCARSPAETSSAQETRRALGKLNRGAGVMGLGGLENS